MLAERLGIDPAPEVVALEASILRQDPRSLVPDARVPSTHRARGWASGRTASSDAEWFFGRDADVAACLAILARSSFLALVGPSGSGKSSLLRAGVAGSAAPSLATGS